MGAHGCPSAHPFPRRTANKPTTHGWPTNPHNHLLCSLTTLPNPIVQVRKGNLTSACLPFQRRKLVVLLSKLVCFALPVLPSTVACLPIEREVCTCSSQPGGCLFKAGNSPPCQLSKLQQARRDKDRVERLHARARPPPPPLQPPRARAQQQTFVAHHTCSALRRLGPKCLPLWLLRLQPHFLCFGQRVVFKKWFLKAGRI